MEELEHEPEPYVAPKYVQCDTLEEFQVATAKVVEFEDNRTEGEYTRTGTTAIYAEPTEDEFPYYFKVEPLWFGLFEEELIDEIPQEEPDVE